MKLFKATIADLTTKPARSPAFREDWSGKNAKRFAVWQHLVRGIRRRRPDKKLKLGITEPSKPDEFLLARLGEIIPIARQLRLPLPSLWRLPLGEKCLNSELKSFERLFQRELITSFNPRHLQARCLYGVSLWLDDEGRLNASCSFGYPRDGSSWTVSYGDWEFDCWCLQGNDIPPPAELGQHLRQKRNEPAADALHRMAAAIEAHCVPRDQYEQRRVLDREEWFRRLHDVLGSALNGWDHGEFRADAATQAVLGGYFPHFRTDDTASMLADLFAHSRGGCAAQNIRALEVEMLSEALRKIRRVQPANNAFDQFQLSISGRNWGLFPPENRPTKRPDYSLLKAGLRLARKVRARVFLRIPRDSDGSKQTGLIRVGLNQVRFDRRRDRIRYAGQWQDIGAIRNIEAKLP